MSLLARKPKPQQAAPAPDPLEDAERELAEIDARLPDAEAERCLFTEALEEERADVEQERTDLVAQLALGRIDELVFEGRESQIESRLEEAAKALSRADAVVAALRTRGGEIADRIAEETCALAEAEVAAAEEREAAAQRLVATRRTEHEEAEERLHDARESARWAKARYDEKEAERKRLADANTLETARSIARHPRWTWDQEAPSASMRALVERERAKMDAEEERYRAEQAALARKSWETAHRTRQEIERLEVEAEAAGRVP